MKEYSGRCRCEKITFKVSGEPTGKLIVITGVKQQAGVRLDHL